MNDAIGWSLDRRPQKKKKKNVNFVVGQIFSLTLFFVVVVVVFSLLSFYAFKKLIFSVHLLIDLDFGIDE